MGNQLPQFSSDRSSLERRLFFAYSSRCFASLSVLAPHIFDILLLLPFAFSLPAAAQPRDVVFVLLGCRAPMLLRQVGTSQYAVVGSCLVLGLNHGEALLGGIPSRYRIMVEDNLDGTWIMMFMEEETGPAIQDPRVIVFEELPTRDGGPQGAVTTAQRNRGDSKCGRR
ncbi:uncharacterized protein PAC_11865 [Phialocephala subalpina]|uniref:Uncharacterized protein n=1 Tax=Phialocephala subalpina TaxID=576137 RepID=A0A1L7XA92_9HELO|nr:uncharacterized protein PAC_11865 [Phialocephala subalpina]